MTYSKKEDYIQRLAELKLLYSVAVTPSARDEIKQKYQTVKGHNAEKFGDVDRLVEVQYRAKRKEYLKLF